MDIQPIKTLVGHTGRVHWAEVYAKDQRILSASEDRTLKIWDATDGRLLHTLEGHTSYIRHAAVSSDGKRAVSASADKTLKVWDLAEGKLLGTIPTPRGTITVTFAGKDKKTLYAIARDGAQNKDWIIGIPMLAKGPKGRGK